MRCLVAWVAAMSMFVGVDRPTLARSSTGFSITEPASDAEGRWPPVHLCSRTLVVPERREAALSALFAGAAEGRRHRIVQLRAIPGPEGRAALDRIGIRLLEYLPQNAWFAFVPADLDPQEPALAWVVASWWIEPPDRTHPELRAGNVPRRTEDVDGRLGVKVLAFEDVDPWSLAADLRSLGARIDGVVERLGLIFARISRECLEDAGTLDGVHWIAPVAPEAGPEMNRPRAYVGTEHVFSSPYGLTGDGVVASVHEMRGVGPHADLEGRVINADHHGSQDSHATKVAGTIAGDGTTNPLYRGMAPQSTILSYAWWGVADMELDRSLDIADALARGADVANNSWGYFCGELPYGDYTVEASTYDRQVRGVDPWGGATGNPMSVVFSSGNERDGSGDDNMTDCITDTNPPFLNYRTINQPKPSKNTIVVGGVDSANDRMSSFSGWGPTSDGRLKPDLVTAGLLHGTPEGGVSVLYPQASMYYQAPDLGCGYGYFAMTSAAAAEATGNVALFVQEFRARNGGADPLPSTVKAFLIHTARDLDDATAWYNPGPDYASGWGVLDIRAAVDRLHEGEWVEACVNQGETDTYWVQVTETTGSVKVTLVWDDYPGSPATTAPALVSQLDLRVEDSGGGRRFPWTLDPLAPLAPARRDRVQSLDNVEQVYVDTQLTPGLWSIHVDGTSLPMGSQCYSVVVSKTVADRDSDGFRVGDDCNDADAEVNPIQFDSCNATDDDCDGTVDGSCDRICDEPRVDAFWPSTIVDRPAPGVQVTNLQMSWNWSDHELGITWSDARDGTIRTYFRPFGLGWTGLWGFGEEKVVADGPGAGISWSGSEYGLWAAEQFVPLHRLGDPLGAPRSTAGAGQRCSTLVWNGENFAATGSYEGDGRLSEFDRQGRLVRSVVVDESGCACDELVWIGDGYGRLTGSLVFERLDPRGEPMASAPVAEAEADPVGCGRIAWNGAGFGVVWLDQRAGTPQVYFRAIDIDGNHLGPEVAITADPLGVVDLDLTSTGQEFGLLRTVQQEVGTTVVFHRLNSDGLPLGGPVRVDEDDIPNYGSRILWTGEHFAVAYRTLYSAYLRILQCCDDADSDGFDECGEDCADDVPSVYPGAPETCDGYRSDCNDPAWPTPPDDEQDADGDGVWHCAGDCNDADPTSRPDLPEACDGSDNDCDGDLDEGCDTSCDAPRVPTADALITPGAVAASDPHLVWNGSGYGLVWSDQRDGNDEIYFARLDASMARIGEEVRLTTAPGSSLSPWIAWTGTEYGVTWQDNRDGNPRIFFVRVSADGVKLGTDRAVAATETATSRLARLVWAGYKYGLFWSDNREGTYGTYFRTISADGATLGTPRMVSTTPSNSGPCRPAWTGSGYAVTYNDDRTGDREIYVALLDADGVRWDPERRVTYSAGYSRSPSIHWMGGDFGVFWVDARSGQDELFYARLGPDGIKIGDDVRLMPATGDLPVHSAAWTGTEFGLAWVDDHDGNLEVYFTRIDGTGLQRIPELRVTENAAPSELPSLGRSGDGFGLVFIDARDGGDAVFGSRLACCRGGFDGDVDGADECSDCDDADASIYPGAPEENDGLDNQCPGDLGFGVVDEISGAITFAADLDKSRITWPEQVGAAMYEVARSSYRDLHAACTLTSTVGPVHEDPQIPDPGSAFYYLIRALVPHLGSWGKRSDGTERVVCSGCEGEGDACDDGEPCTMGDRCSAGTCTGTGPTDHVVISQVQVAGNTIADEFVELYNPSDTGSSLAGWTLQRRYNGFYYILHRFGAADAVPPHGWFLVANPAYDGPLSPDARWSFSGDALWGNPFGDGAVLLVVDGTLVQSCADGRVFDSVSWTTPCADGPPVPSVPEPEYCLTRKPGWSCGNGQDSANNAEDFLHPLPSEPRNSSSPPLP